MGWGEPAWGLGPGAWGCPSCAQVCNRRVKQGLWLSEKPQEPMGPTADCRFWGEWRCEVSRSVGKANRPSKRWW